MPSYDYECEGCGPFTAMRPMAQYRDPCACPECGALAERTLASAPGIASGNASLPGRSEPGPATKAHPAGCGCCMRRWPLPSALSGPGAQLFTAYGPVRPGES